jgi:TrmH family RNA methyltransferase
VKCITSAANTRYKALLKLAHSSRERRKAGLSLLDGIHLISAYHDHAGVPEEVAVSASMSQQQEIRDLLATLQPLQPLLLTDALFRALSTVETPTGVIAAVRTPQPPVVAAGIESCVMLEDLQDPGNLGSVLRSAAAAGFERVFLSKHSVHGWSPRVLRAGMGAHFMLHLHEQCDLLELARGFDGRVIAASPRAKRSVFDADLTGRIALVFGNEGTGLSPALARVVHEVVAIPMPGKVESLNVAAAAAICLFERVRQLHATRDGLTDRRMD